VQIRGDWSGDLNYLQLILSMADMLLGWILIGIIFFVECAAIISLLLHIDPTTPPLPEVERELAAGYAGEHPENKVTPSALLILPSGPSLIN
jgi:hypothetical protein